MNSRMLKITITGFAVILISSCDNPFGGSASKVDNGHLPGITSNIGTTIPSAPGSEFVSSSQQLKTTLGGRFKLDATVASPTEELKLSTTSRGYKLYSNIQGSLISGEQ